MSVSSSPTVVAVSVCFRVGRLVSAVVPIAALLLAAGGCGQTGAASDPAAANGRQGGAGGTSVPVLTAAAVLKDVPQLVQTVGTVEAYSTVSIEPLVSGTVTTVSFAEGQDVAKGDLLFKIDPQPYQVALDQAKATLAKDAAQANNAEAMRARNANLLARGILDQQDYETSATTAASLQAAVNADQAQVDSAKLQLQYTTILSPLSGQTGSLLIHEGNLVWTASPTPMVVINQISPIRVAFGLPAQYLSEVRTSRAASALEVTARAAGSHDAVSRGTVSFLDNAVDPSTGTLKVKGTFANDDRKLWPGELVEISLRLVVARQVTVVPAEAVQNGQQGQYVYVVKADRTVAFRAVQVSLRNGDDVVVTSGLKVGEEVVTDGVLGLTPGARIQVKNTGGGAAGARGAHP
jgi:membrane fusion protein, multidrug efflux system